MQTNALMDGQTKKNLIVVFHSFVNVSKTVSDSYLVIFDTGSQII